MAGVGTDNKPNWPTPGTVNTNQESSNIAGKLI